MTVVVIVVVVVVRPSGFIPQAIQSWSVVVAIFYVKTHAHLVGIMQHN